MVSARSLSFFAHAAAVATAYEIKFGSNSNAASISATCEHAGANVATMTPTVFESDFGGIVTAYMKNVEKNCIDVKYGVPCVNHSDAYPPLFWCEFSGSNGSETYGPFPAFTKAYTGADAVKHLETYMECQTPLHDKVATLSGYDGVAGTETLELNIKYGTSSSLADITWDGVPSGNKITFNGLLVPPAPPAPPFPPAPPSPPPPPAWVSKTFSGEEYTLVMKLSKNDFCYGSSKWTDGLDFNMNLMLDDTFPNHKQYDAKLALFHTYRTNKLLLEVMRGTTFSQIPISFNDYDTPEKLMLTTTTGISTPNYNSWRSAYGQDRTGDAFFQRGGAGRGLRGCGRPCNFCYQAHDIGNDVSSGIGLNAGGCGGGDASDCSSSGNWAGDSRTLVWINGADESTQFTDA